MEEGEVVVEEQECCYWAFVELVEQEVGVLCVEELTY